MKPKLFAEVWAAAWSHRPLSDVALRLIWGPEVVKVDDGPAVTFLRTWARENPWPPSLHDFLVGVGAVSANKPVKVSKSKSVLYTCEHCGTQVDGTLEFDKHIEAEHADEMADPDTVNSLIEGWKAQRAQTLDLTQDEDESPTDGTPETGEEDATDSSANNGNDDQDPMESAVAEGRKPTQEERAQLMESQAGLKVGGDPQTDAPQEPAAGAPEPELVPNTDNTPVDDQEAWELASRNLRDHDGHRVTAKAAVQPCTICDVFAIGLVFRAAPVDVPAAGVERGEAMAGRCWGCQNLGRSDRFGMPTPTQKTRSAWKRLSDTVAPKGWKKPERAKWINAALKRTRGMLRVRAEAAANPPDTSEPCKTCGDQESGSRLLFGTADATLDTIYAGLCWDCGGSALYREPAEDGGWSGLPIAGTTKHWVTYDTLFTEDASRVTVISKAVQRSKATDSWPPDLLLPSEWQDDGEPTPTPSHGDGESLGVSLPEGMGEASPKPSEADFDDDLPC